ncbi:MAG: enoyl-CoA hydratase-related protein [Alphaproteobacteria bacterium]
MNPDELPIVEKRGAVQWITLNRPQVRNALNAEVQAAIGDGILAAQRDRDIRAIVITGHGRAFSAGADLRPDVEGSAFDITPDDPGHAGTRLFRIVEACDLPIVARVNGDAVAGGTALVCAADMAVAVSTARFGVPEVRIGIFPIHVMPYLMRMVPRKKFLEMSITGELLTAAQALDAGLLNYVVPPEDLDAKVDWLLGRIIDKSPSGIRVGKRTWHAMQDMAIQEAFAYADTAFGLIVQTEDTAEGLAAFNAKRKPEWKNR